MFWVLSERDEQVKAVCKVPRYEGAVTEAKAERVIWASSPESLRLSVEGEIFPVLKDGHSLVLYYGIPVSIYAYVNVQPNAEPSIIRDSRLSICISFHHAEHPWHSEAAPILTR